MTEVHLIDVLEQPVAGVRQRVRMDELTGVFDTRFQEVLAALHTAGRHPAGAPYARYRGEPTDTIDVEIGFPVDGPFTVTGDVVPGTLPAVRAAEAVHVGSYDGLPATYDEMFAWISEHGLNAMDEMWEVYESGMESDPDPATWRTRIVWPVTGPALTP